GLASVEPVDRWGRYNRRALQYFEESMTTHKFRGLLLTPPYCHYRSDDPQVYPFYEKALELNAIVQFHHCANPGGIFLAPYKYANPQSLNNVLVDFPGLRVVVEHLNYPWVEELFFMMMNPDVNVYADLAMTYNRPIALTWNLVKAKEMGIMDRILYGSDYWATGSGVFSRQPGEDMKRWIKLIRTGINETAERCGWPIFTQDEIDKILYKNAAQLYDFDPDSFQIDRKT
ncbi:MAG: amidohydrolase family protein, partial [bacterium]